MITDRKLSIFKVKSELRMMVLKEFRANQGQEINYVKPAPEKTALRNAEQPTQPKPENWLGG